MFYKYLSISSILITLGVSSGCLKYEKSPLDSAQGGEFGPLATLLLGSRPAHFLAFTNTMTLLELQGNGEWTSINYNSGGSIFIHLTPMAFTNFFLLHKDNKEYYDRVMSYFRYKAEVVVWSDSYRDRDNGSRGNSSSRRRPPPPR